MRYKPVNGSLTTEITEIIDIILGKKLTTETPRRRVEK